MEIQRDLAIVLRSIPYEDRHRIVTAITEQHGVITGMARNAIQSRRFGGTLDPFAASQWHFVRKAGADLVRIEEALIRRSFEGLRSDFDRLSLASVMNELMLRLAPKYEACPDLFRLHSNALAYLEDQATEGTRLLKAAENRSGPNAAAGALATGATRGEDLALLNGYLSKLLQWSGNQPQLGSCLGCQIPIENVSLELSLTCVVSDAGWLCPECRTVETRHIRERQGQSFQHSLLRVTPGAIRDFHMSLQLPIRQIPAMAEASKKEHQDLFKFLEALFVYHMPGFDQKPLKSLRFLDLESKTPPPSTNSR